MVFKADYKRRQIPQPGRPWQTCARPVERAKWNQPLSESQPTERLTIVRENCDCILSHTYLGVYPQPGTRKELRHHPPLDEPHAVSTRPKLRPSLSAAFPPLSSLSHRTLRRQPLPAVLSHRTPRRQP